MTRTVRDAVEAPLHVRTTTYDFDPDGYLVKTVDALQNEVRYTRDPQNQKRITLEEVYEYRAIPPLAPQPVLTKRVDSGYDLEGNLQLRSVQLENEVVTESWTYDQGWIASHRIVSSLDPGHPFGTVYTFKRSGPGANDPITNISEIKQVTAWDSQSPPQPQSFEITSFGYDANGQLESVTPPEVASPDGLRIIRRHYGTSDSHPGLLREVELEVGGSPAPHLNQTMTYDDHGFLATVTDALNNPTTYVRDDLGRIEQITNAAQEMTLYSYSGPNEGLANPLTAPPGNLLASIERGRTAAEGEGQVQRLRWDALGRLVRIERKDDANVFHDFIRYTLDSDGNRLEEFDGENRKTQFDYDDLGRLMRITDPAGNPPMRFVYDGRGNRTSVIDSRNIETRFSYDSLDRLIGVTEDATGLDLTTQFTLDAAGKVTRVTDPKSQITSYAYDRLSRLTQVKQHLNQAVNYGYDARGRLETTTNARGQVLRYFYFPWGGLQRVAHDLDADGEEPSERKVSYTYDYNGNVLATVDTDNPTGELANGSELPLNRLYSFAYDPLNRVSQVTAHYLPGSGSADPQLVNAYDRFGHRARLQLTDNHATSPRVQGWSFDDRDRLRTVCMPQDMPMGASCVPGTGTETLAFSYLENDDIDTLTHGNGLITDFTYHPEGPIESITVGTAPLHRLFYAIDAVGNVDTIQETIAGTVQSPLYDYGYDGAERLASAAYPTGLGLPTAPESFGYDDAGNRDNDPAASSPWRYDANNRIEASPGSSADVTYGFDADGNLISRNGAARALTWDATNRLQTVDDSATGTSTYRRDPFGRRIQKTTGGATTYYLWDGDQLLAEYSGSGSRQVRYAYAEGFAPVQVAYVDGSSETVYDVHSDHLDTPKVLTDANDAVVWRASHEAFGEAALDPASSVTFNLRFPGQYYDAESGLHDNRYRYYEPDLGRYLSADPIGQAGDPNVYGYALANPINVIDPYGLCPPCLVIAGVCSGGACELLGLGVGMGIGMAMANAPPCPPPATPKPDPCKFLKKVSRELFLSCLMWMGGGDAPEPPPDPKPPPPISGPQRPGPGGGRPKPPGGGGEPPTLPEPPRAPPEPPGRPGPGGGKPPWPGL